MNRALCILTTLLLVIISLDATSQVKDTVISDVIKKSVFDEKFNWGITFHQYWGTIKGSDLPKEYFAKPCFGASLRSEYYPVSFVGVGIGFGIQQRGAGIKNQDNYGGSFTHPWESVYDPDSTYRERLRINTLEIPVSVLFRTPRDIVRGVRLSASAGVVLMKNTYAKDFWHSPEDGFHTIVDVSDEYIKNDLGYQCSFGADINAAESCIFQFHLVYSRGTKNIYNTGAGNGRAETFGFRLSWLF